MEQEPKRVLIVQAGRFGPEHYASFVEELKDILLEAKLPTDSKDEKPRSAAVVNIVRSADEAKDLMDKRWFHIVIFVSVDMLEPARELRAKYNNTDVYVLPGRPVENEPYIVPKKMIVGTGFEQILRDL